MISKVYIAKRGAKTVQEWAFDKQATGTLTTEHSASSYGQPIILEDGSKLLDYSQIEALTLPFGTPDEVLEAARSLESFGIKISRDTVDPSTYA